jgi:hypothetical protein
MINSIVALSFLSAFFLITLVVRKNEELEDKFVVFIIILIMADMLINAQVNHINNYSVCPKNSCTKLKMTSVDRFLAADTTFFRVYPLKQEFINNRWGLYGRTIGGTSNQYYEKYTDFLNRTLSKSIRYRDPFNWNILNMLGVKYIINDERVISKNLKFAYYDKNNGQSVYENKEVLPYSWYPKNIEFVDNDNTIIRKLSNFNYDAKNVVLSTVDIKDVKYHKKNKIISEKLFSDSLTIVVHNKTKALLVISELYYPNSWIADIDGISSKIIPINSILRGIIVDKGKHKIKMRFKVPLIKEWKRYNLIGMVLPLILIVIGIYFNIRSKFKGEIEYVLKYYE